LPRPLFEAPQHHRRIPIEAGSSVLGQFLQRGLDFGQQSLGRKGGGPVFVENAAPSRFECGGQGARSLLDVFIRQVLKRVTTIPANHRGKQHEQIRLPIAESPHYGHQSVPVLLLLSLDDGSRVRTGG
jgi:hypothetical protein